ncbi:oxidoreductase, aldo/keto reductase [Nitzschia inconspicua]|uniref:Oxidoreductase, aldo/keto reductase n=1 Tax=Nitzschia inconspicua TaxID=303405 RepID=A0A9K3Q8Q8_9STRA|nr:oxidoreductase, aldo/keto reductase [Nitzschia inconspicua]
MVHEFSPISAIQHDWNTWVRNYEEILFATFRELDIRIDAYSPLGRGYFKGTVRERASDVLGKQDLRLMGFRKASEEKLPQNFPLVDEVAKLAIEMGITVGRLAVAGL